MKCSLGLLGAILILSGCDPNATPTVGDSPADAGLKDRNGVSQRFAHAEKRFNDYCAACHRRGGQGEKGRVPPLNNSPWISGSEERLIRIVLNGLRGPIEIDGESYNLEMPAFRRIFQDDDIASVLSYARHRYGAPSPPIESETVARVRKATQDRTGYWTVEELLKVP